MVQDGISLLITERARNYVDGAKIDYVYRKTEEGFVISAKVPDPPKWDDEW